jgi:hypothetical protein
MLRAVSRIVALAAIASLVACNGGGGASSSLLPSQPNAPLLSPTNGSPSFGVPAARPICPPTHNLNQMRCYAWMRTDIVPDLSTTHGVPPIGFTASDIESAYNLNVTKGAGQTVAIVDAFGYAQAAKDLAVYRSASGLPACTTATGCLTILNQNGQKKPLPKPNPITYDDWRPEQALDLDAVSAACPKCHIVLVQANSDFNSDLYTAEAVAAKHSHIVSNSYGGPEFGSATNPAFETPNTMFVASAGDSGGGTSTHGAAMPCAYATVVCVGGTALTQGGGTRGWSEVAWNDLKSDECGAGGCGATGSGCSKIVAKPSWQTDTASGGCTMRSESDVSASASPLHAFVIYVSTGGGWNAYGGTSLAAPLIAGVFGLSGNASSRHSAQELWGAKSGFNDVTSGTNFYKPIGGKCASKVKYICTAGPGYDGPTGLGTPSGTSAF